MSMPNSSQQDGHVADATMAVSPLNEEVEAQPLVLPEGPALEEPYYTLEEDEDPNAAVTPLAAPFGLSQEMPPVEARSSGEMAISPPPALPQKSSGKPRFSLMFIAIIVCVIVIVGFLVMSALAQPSSPMEMRNNQPARITQPAKPTPTQAPTNQNPLPGNGQTTGNPTNGVPQQLPTGWMNAGLTTSDAIEAQRTAMAFTDREMSLDFRSAGTRNNHGGTFTSATFLLTPAGKQRFAQNDVRVTNNTLWDKVQQEKLIQSVVDAQPQLVQFMQQGQQQLAWVDASFHLWQTKLDGQGMQTEGFDTDPATNQPRVHHLMVVLLHVPPQNAGANPPMGGTGWLVSTYALDLPAGTQLQMVTPA